MKRLKFQYHADAPSKVAFGDLSSYCGSLGGYPLDLTSAPEFAHVNGMMGKICINVKILIQWSPLIVITSQNPK